MTDSKLSLNDHIRGLTYDRGTESKIASLDYIVDTAIINDRTVSAVMIALDDRSNDETLRKHGIISIQKMLENTRHPEEKDCIMRHLMTRIFGRYFDETVIGHKDLFETVVKTISNNIDDMDHLFVHLMYNVKKVQEINYNSYDLPKQVAKFFERNHQKDNLRSKQVFSRIANERHLETLFNLDTPRNTLETTLDLLGDRSLAKIDFNLVAAHLSPVLNSRQSDAKKAVKMALNNIQRWANEFPSKIEEVSQQRVSLHNWFHAPDEHNIDDLTMKQLGMNTLFVPELVSILTEPKKRNTLADPAQLFELLKYFNNIRSNRYMERICTFISSERHAAKPEAFPYLAAIDFLDSHYTGLDVYQPSSEPNKQESQEERYRRRLLIDGNLRADQLIKKTLLQLTLNEQLPDQIRAKAWSVIIEKMPADLYKLLNEHLPTLQTNDTLLNGTLKNIESIYSIQSYPLLERLWLQRGNFKIEIQEQIIRALGAVGSYDIVTLLIPVVFDDPQERLKQLAKDVLVNEGYEVEIEREAHRRKILSLHAQEKEVSKNIVENEERIKSLHLEINQTQVNYNVNAQELSYYLNELDSFLLGRKLEMADNAIEQAKLKGKIEVLLRRLGEVFQEIKVITQRLNEKVRLADNLLSQIRSTEQEILRKDKELRNARKQLQQEQRNLQRLRSDDRSCASNLDSIKRKYESARSEYNSLGRKINGLQSDLSNLERRRRQAAAAANSGQNNFFQSSSVASLDSKIRSKEGDISRARGRYNEQNRKVNNLSGEMGREQSRLRKIRNGISQTQNSISNLERLIPSLEQDISRLQSRHDKLAMRLREINIDIDQYRAQVNQHSNTADRLQAQVNQLQGELNVVINQFNSIQEKTNQGARQRSNHLSELRNAGQALNQYLQELGEDFTTTENLLSNLKTEKQRLIQLVEVEREHYDQIGDRANMETTKANLRNEHRSSENAVRNIGEDEIRLAKDKTIERSVKVFSNRFLNTRSLQNRIKN